MFPRILSLCYKHCAIINRKKIALWEKITDGGAKKKKKTSGFFLYFRLDADVLGFSMYKQHHGICFHFLLQ